jgi:hypothetical protein
MPRSPKHIAKVPRRGRHGWRTSGDRALVHAPRSLVLFATDDPFHAGPARGEHRLTELERQAHPSRCCRFALHGFSLTGWNARPKPMQRLPFVRNHHGCGPNAKKVTAEAFA